MKPKQVGWMMGALLLLAGPVWAINKCTGADGKVAFQDTACAVTAKTVVERRKLVPAFEAEIKKSKCE